MSDLVTRLRNTPNWMRQEYGNWKEATNVYDRAPFEAAARIETLEALLKEAQRILYVLRWEDELLLRIDAALKEKA